MRTLDEWLEEIGEFDTDPLADSFPQAEFGHAPAGFWSVSETGSGDGQAGEDLMRRLNPA